MSGIFHAECSCEYTVGIAKIEVCRTDHEAVARVWSHWINRLTGDSDHRYWVVHGPSGHLIALRDTPYGPMPPHPDPIEISPRT